MDVCDEVVEIPVYGLKNSLNVCSAATVAVYEVIESRYMGSNIPTVTLSTYYRMRFGQALLLSLNLVGLISNVAA